MTHHIHFGLDVMNRQGSSTNQLRSSDGRRLRSERSKEAILQAVEQLVNDGILVPTAQGIADAAGMPIRSFFRHFPDMESLFEAFDQKLKREYERLYAAGVPEGSLSERIALAVQLHAHNFEVNKSAFRSTKAQLWRYQALQDNYAYAQRCFRKHLDQRLPELRALPEDKREMVDAMTSYEMWARLRDHQHLSVERATSMVESMVSTLLADCAKPRDNL